MSHPESSRIPQGMQDADTDAGDDKLDSIIFAVHEFIVELGLWYRTIRTRSAPADVNNKGHALAKLWSNVRSKFMDQLQNDADCQTLASFNRAFDDVIVKDLTGQADVFCTAITSASFCLKLSFKFLV